MYIPDSYYQFRDKYRMFTDLSVKQLTSMYSLPVTDKPCQAGYNVLLIHICLYVLYLHICTCHYNKLINHHTTILVANVYVYCLEKWLLRQLLLSCYKKLKKCQIYQEIGGCYKRVSVLPILVSVGVFFRLNAILPVLNWCSCLVQNNCEIPLSLYIRLGL